MEIKLNRLPLETQIDLRFNQIEHQITQMVKDVDARFDLFEKRIMASLDKLDVVEYP